VGLEMSARVCKVAVNLGNKAVINVLATPSTAG
jgi:hypothetical protein